MRPRLRPERLDIVADNDIPELPFEETVGVLSFIQPRWWDEHPDATSEAVAVAEWLDFHVKRRRPQDGDSDRPVQRLTMTVEEAAVALGISRAFAYEAVACGEIPCIRIGRRILIPKVALERLLNSGSDEVGGRPDR